MISFHLNWYVRIQISKKKNMFIPTQETAEIFSPHMLFNKKEKKKKEKQETSLPSLLSPSAFLLLFLCCSFLCCHSPALLSWPSCAPSSPLSSAAVSAKEKKKLYTICTETL
jgi:hypothetical protein